MGGERTAAVGGIDKPVPGLRSWAFELLRGDKSFLVWVLVAALLGALVLMPMGRLFFISLEGPAGLSLDNYVAAFGNPIYHRPILNSLTVAFGAGLLSILVGVPIAWVLSRTDVPWSGALRVLVFGSLVTPSLLGAMAWILLGGPNAGILNRLYMAVTGSTAGLFDIFSLGGIIFVIFLYTYPYAVILVSAALESSSSEMEDAAEILGAGTVRTTVTVSLPLVLPAILGAFILAFLEAIALFGIPAMIGIPARMHVMTTQIWAFFQNQPPRVGLAAAYALPLLAVTVGLLLLQKWVLGRKGYATVTGKAGYRRIVHLGKARWPVFVGCLMVVSCSVILPYVVLTGTALTRAWGLGFQPGNLTLDNLTLVLFQHTGTRLAIGNSLQLAAGTATIATAMAAIIAYVHLRGILRGHQVLGFLAMVPWVVPSIVLAVGLFAAYSRPPLLLYGTIWILMIAYITKFLPIAYTSANAAVRSVHPELEEAATILGASRLRALKDITVPLIKVGLVAGWIMAFMPSIGEFSSSILLFTSRTRVISTTIFDLYEEGKWEVVSAIGVVLLVMTLLMAAIGYRLFGKSFIKLQG